MRPLVYFTLPHFQEELSLILFSPIEKRYLVFLYLYESASLSKEYEISTDNNSIYKHYFGNLLLALLFRDRTFGIMKRSEFRGNIKIYTQTYIVHPFIHY